MCRDRLDKQARSELMARVRSKNTGLEMRVRRALHAAGFRYRLHDRALPGTPDLVLRKYKTVIQIRGCFWHQHDDPDCPGSRMPKSRQAYWYPKLRRNVERDQATDAALRDLGWRVLTVWECQCRTEAKLSQAIEAIRRTLDEGSATQPG